MQETPPGDDARPDLRSWLKSIPTQPRVIAHRLMWEASPVLATVLALSVLAGAVVSPAFALLTGALVTGVTTEAGPVGPLVGLGALYTFQQVVGPARGAIAVALSRRIDDRMRSRMMLAMLEPHGVAHLEDPSLQNDLELARGIAWGASPGSTVEGLSSLWLARLSAIGALVLVAQFRWWLGVMLLAAGLITLRSKKKSFFNMTAIYTKRAEELRRSAYFRDVALGRDAAKETRVFGLGPWASDRFDAAWLETMTELWKERKRGSLVVIAGLVVKGVFTFAAFLYAARAGLNGELALGSFVVVLQALMSSAGLSTVLGNPELMVDQGTSAITPALAVERDLAIHPASEIRGERDPAGMPREKIRFEGVGFVYPGRDEPVFRSLDLDIPAGRSLAIVGDNGAGKTTIVKLLTRLYDPTSGRITVDGVPLSEIDPALWHRRIAAIFQDFGRYALTAAENVGLSSFGGRVDVEALDRVADRVGIGGLIKGWEHGWDSILNRQFERGVEVSGGEWQRVALARALFAVETGAQVLVLDEPTAQLDVRSEAELYDRFLELTRGLTTIVISHRFSTVRRADRIVVIEHGQTCEIGNHEELLELNGRYAEMFNLQASRFTA